MLDKIENSFRDLICALQVARLYPDWHPEFKKSIDKAYVSLADVLTQKENLVIGIVGEELAYEKEIFFGLSKTARQMILYLKDRGIERIEFLRGLEAGELSKFISFLIMPKDEIRHAPEEELPLLGVRNIIAGKIKAGPLDMKEKGERLVNYLNLYEDSLNKINNSVEAVLNGEAVDRLALRMTVTNVMENLLGRYQEFLNFASVKRYDLKTFSHIINVSLLSMYFSLKLGFTKEEVLDIGTAALFHDIGKLYISRRILTKPTRLTDEEFARVKSHVTLGAQIILKYTDSLGYLPVVVCFEHHLRYNLSGYPRLSFPCPPHIASLIVCICDVYDALSQRRGYKSDYPPQMIYELMNREKGTSFEPELLDKFFRIVGVWPVGTVVRLSDERVAVVRQENEDDIFSPKVEVIAPAKEKEMLDLRKQKDKLKIETFLSPFKDGKEYLPLI